MILGADLRGARLGAAVLVGASLRGADLRGAYLRVARLEGADLSGADLRETLGLTRAQLQHVRCDSATRVPASLLGGEIGEG